MEEGSHRMTSKEKKRHYKIGYSTKRKAKKECQGRKVTNGGKEGAVKKKERRREVLKGEGSAGRKEEG